LCGIQPVSCNLPDSSFSQSFLEGISWLLSLTGMSAGFVSASFSCASLVTSS